MQVEYLYQVGVNPAAKEPLKVRCDGKIIGSIKKVEGGYQYFPTGYKEGGEILSSVSAVQKTL